MKLSFSRLTTNQRLALLAFLLGLVSLAARPTWQGTVSLAPEELAVSIERKADRVSAADLADWIIQGRADFRLIDLRAARAYAAYRIPGAENVAMTRLPEAGLARNEKILVYGEDGVQGAQAWFLLKARGYKGVYLLDGGLEAWKSEVLFPRVGEAATPEARQWNERRRTVSLHFGGTPLAAGDASGAPALAPPLPAPSVPVVQSPAGGRPPAKKKRKEGC